MEENLKLIEEEYLVIEGDNIVLSKLYTVTGKEKVNTILRMNQLTGLTTRVYLMSKSLGILLMGFYQSLTCREVK